MSDYKKGELSQLLVGGAKGKAAIDSTLDDLFKNAPPPAPAKPVATKPKPATPAEPAEDAGSAGSANGGEPKKAKKNKKSKNKAADAQETSQPPARTNEDAELIAKAKAKRARRFGLSVDDDDEAGEEDENKPKNSKRQLLGRMPQDPETVARTAFVGNLNIACITDKKVYADLKAMCTNYGKVKAIRFRSIAFSNLLPRKVAFIQGDFHSDRQTCNAYVEFAEEESAKKCVELNGTVFQDKHIRVDLAGNEKTHDMKRSVFVGNLDFAAEEEDLWRHFGTCGTIENVRIVRDPKTNIGKGFAYVQFTDRAAVTLAVKLHDSELNSRKLRVKRASEKAIKEKKRALEASGASGTAVLEGTRSVKGDKPSNKKRRTDRSKAFAEGRLNSANASSAGTRGRPRGASRGGRGGMKKHR
ncbi:Nucleolar protein 12 [Dipsacomyces acuminosporus]|nr:Nucleolar protein 12 [Dipsacomyces acuminosporus]